MEAITELLPVSISPSTWDKEKDLGDICNLFSFGWKAFTGIKPQKVKKKIYSEELLDKIVTRFLNPQKM